MVQRENPIFPAVKMQSLFAPTRFRSALPLIIKLLKPR